jgi:hypothetical protein
MLALCRRAGRLLARTFDDSRAADGQSVLALDEEIQGTVCEPVTGPRL